MHPAPAELAPREVEPGRRPRGLGRGVLVRGDGALRGAGRRVDSAAAVDGAELMTQG